jgi:hypothetical protein
MTRHVITIDFETYYDQNFTLEKLPTAEYVESPDFEIIGVGFKLDTEPTEWVAGHAEAQQAVAALPWDDAVCVAHNAQFDGLILESWCRVFPIRYFCTSMAARPVVAPHKGNTKLATVAEFFNFGVKGNEVHNAKGKRLGDFSPSELARYGEYCKNDVNLTYMVYNLLLAWYERTNRNVA